MILVDKEKKLTLYRRNKGIYKAIEERQLATETTYHGK